MKEKKETRTGAGQAFVVGIVELQRLMAVITIRGSIVVLHLESVSVVVSHCLGL